MIMTTVSSHNRTEVPDIIDTVVKAGVDIFAFSRYVPTGGEIDDSMTAMQYRALLQCCDAKFRAYEVAGCKTYFNKKDHLWTLYDYETGNFTLPEGREEGMIYGGCNCGNGHLTILPTGEVYACRRVSNSSVGSVWENRLADLWICEMERYRDYTEFEKCSRCELLPYCRGCPAVAKGQNGSFYASDPQCWKEIDEQGGKTAC